MSDIVCLHCHFIGKPKRLKRGSGQLERIGWMLFPLGVPYTLWRMLAKKPACASCGGEHIVPAESMAGQRLIKIVAGESVTPAARELPPEKWANPERKKLPPQDPNAW